MPSPQVDTDGDGRWNSIVSYEITIFRVCW